MLFFRAPLVIITLAVMAGGCATASPASVAGPPCPGGTEATVSPAKGTVMVSYTEPTANIAGKPLQSLTKTTIYYDLGAGRVAAKEVPATKASGGGHIVETITVPVKGSQDARARICVTATDGNGNESPMTP